MQIDLYEVVRKLIGPVNPIGETGEDEVRFNNLVKLVDLVDKLISDLGQVASNKDRVEYSIKKCGEFADRFLIRLGIF